MKKTFDVFLWSKRMTFGVTTLISTHDCIQSSSAFAAVEKAMRAHRFSVVGHAVAEVVSGGGSLLYYRAYGVRLGVVSAPRKQEMVGARALL